MRSPHGVPVESTLDKIRQGVLGVLGFLGFFLYFLKFGLGLSVDSPRTPRESTGSPQGVPGSP